MLIANAVNFSPTFCADTPAPGAPNATDIVRAANASVGTVRIRIVISSIYSHFNHSPQSFNPTLSSHARPAGSQPVRSGYTSRGQRSATTTFGRAVVSGPLCLPRDGRRDRDAPCPDARDLARRQCPRSVARHRPDERRGVGRDRPWRGGGEGARDRHSRSRGGGSCPDCRFERAARWALPRHREPEAQRHRARDRALQQATATRRPRRCSVRGLQPRPQRLPAGRLPSPAGRAGDCALPSRGGLARRGLARAVERRLARSPCRLRCRLQPGRPERPTNVGQQA